MSLPIFAFENKIIDDATTLNPSTQSQKYPASNLKLHRLSPPWRTTAVCSENLVIDFGSQTDLEIFFIDRRHNFTSQASVTLELNTANDWNSPAWSHTFQVAEANPVADTFASQTYQYARVSISDSTNADGYLEIPYLYLGKAHSLSRGMLKGYSEQYSRKTIINEDAGGTPATLSTSDLTWSASMQFRCNAVDREILKDVIIYANDYKPFIFSSDPEGDTFSLMYLQSPAKTEIRHRIGQFSIAELSLSEAGGAA